MSSLEVFISNAYKRALGQETQAFAQRSTQEVDRMNVVWGRQGGGWYNASTSSTTSSAAVDFGKIKRSLAVIEAEPFDGTVRQRIEAKINRLHNGGAVSQALVLEGELRTRDVLVRLKEWDYKILTKNTIDKFQANNQVTLTRDGLRVHIDPLEKYVGNPQSGHIKNQIIPDSVLDKLEEAKERELFDEFHVLWAEKVKDPLLLGSVYGCEDYFFICEWGDDITFEQIMNGGK